MPPANSPDPGQPPSFISALRELESPVNEDVLNLAATLGTQPDDDQDDADTLTRHRENLLLLERQRGEELAQRDRLRRVMSRLSRLSDSTGAYGDRVPSQNNLYDWSPANEADDEHDLDQIFAELRDQPDNHSEILRLLELDSERDRLLEERARLSQSGTRRLESERARIRSRLQGTQAPGSISTDGSLRSTAMLQSLRRHPRFSARTREHPRPYTPDLERNLRSDMYHSDASARDVAMQRLAEGRTSYERTVQSDRDRRRRNYQERTSNSAPTASPMLEQTVKYLSWIRNSNSMEESIDYALDAGFNHKEHESHRSDFVSGTYSIPPPSETSWLAPGAVLSGCQHATSGSAALNANNPSSLSSLYTPSAFDSSGRVSMLARPSRPSWASASWASGGYTQSANQGSQTEAASSQAFQQDRWPVKVTVHSVDWDKMSLSATMEAYNVPSNPHLHQSLLSAADGSLPQFTRTSSITTYLEGEILDFNTHTLLTESFKSNAANDATYWRKLPPFQDMSDDAIVANLTSTKWITEVLCKEWVLMRWKERCFVKSLNRSSSSTHELPEQHSTSYTMRSPADDTRPPWRIVRNSTTGLAEVEISPLFEGSSSSLPPDGDHATFDDSGCGLTISGFYYVCLRRSDGKLEGLYYDPQSSPYQCLKLDSVRGGVFPAWGFR